MSKGKGLFPSLHSAHLSAGKRGLQKQALRGAAKYAAEYALLCELFGDPPDPWAVYEAVRRVPAERAGHARGFVRFRFLPLQRSEAHRLIAAAVRGGPLRRDEQVHHVDGNRRNNRPDNLQIVGSVFHHVEKHSRAGGMRPTSGLKFTSGPNRGRSVGRHILEELMGVRLRSTEVVGYRDGNKTNIDASNLYVETRATVVRKAWVNRRAKAATG